MQKARKMRRIHRSREEIKKIIEDFKSSNLSLSAFAKSVRLPPASLRMWVLKSKENTEGSSESSPLFRYTWSKRR